MVNRPISVAIALAADRLLGEPPTRWHPVAWFGRFMGEVERRLHRDAVDAGLAYTAVGVAAGAGAGMVLRSTAVATTVAVAGRELRSVAGHVEQPLRAGDLDGARELLPSLVGRDPSQLDASGISAAVVESVAENTVDAVVGPVFWALVAGAPGVLAHRCINTMDAMVGHRSERYERFGKTSARLDDAANWIPARLTAVLFAIVGPRPWGRVRTLVRRDAHRHPSPNAGVAETAAAAALGVQLGGSLTYGERVEHRPRLGDGPRPDAGHIGQMNDLARRAENALGLGCLAVGAARLARRGLAR